jgi:calcium-dependent protein kinase
MKIIKKEKLKNSQAKDELMMEVSILKQLDHPNIVKLIEMFEDDRYFYIVQE